jgi:hypothetical protein
LERKQPICRPRRGPGWMEVDRPATPEKLVPGPQQRVDLPQFIQLGLMIIVVISQNSPYEHFLRKRDD